APTANRRSWCKEFTAEIAEATEEENESSVPFSPLRGENGQSRHNYWNQYRLHARLSFSAVSAFNHDFHPTRSPRLRRFGRTRSAPAAAAHRHHHGRQR